jgi:hypothetical protein
MCPSKSTTNPEPLPEGFEIRTMPAIASSIICVRVRAVFDEGGPPIRNRSRRIGVLLSARQLER